ncbi:hypothetical protein ACVWZV_000311 [Bradyrhizobium sp. GM5.1]
MSERTSVDVYAKAKRSMIMGAALLFGCGGVTFWTHSEAMKSGGRYIIFF